MCSRRWLLVARGVLGFLAVSSLYWSVSLNTLADSSTLQFLSPIFVAMLRCASTWEPSRVYYCDSSITLRLHML